MKEEDETKEQLIDELAEMRQRAAELGASELGRKQAQERLAKLNECFLEFGADPLKNINHLTALCGELLGATCALYNRLDQGMLCSWGQWNTPPGYNPVDRPDGHICYDVIKQGRDQVLVVRNLPETRYAQTDPNVIPYKLQTYVGRAVKFADAYIGSLCVVYQSDFVPCEEDNRLMGIIASAIGVEEEHKQVEDALRESEARYRAVIEDQTELICRFLPDGALTFVNEAYCRYFGKRQEGLIGHSCMPLIPEEEREFVANQFSSLSMENPTVTYEHRVVATGGEIRWQQWTDRAIFDEQGRIVEYQSVGRDITDRVQANEEIRRRNRELAALNTMTSAMMRSALNLDEVLQRTTDGIVEGLSCNTAFLFLLDKEEKVFKGSVVSTKSKMLARINAIIGFPWLQIKVPARSDFNEAMSNLLAGRATIRDDLYELVGPLLSRTACSAIQKLLDSRTFFAMPLLAKGKTVGGIIASTREKLSEADTEKLMTFANQAAIAIENARLHEETRRRALEQETVSRVAYALNTPDVRDAFPVLVEGLRDLTGCDLVNLIMLDEANEQFIMSVLESPFPIPGAGDVMPLSATAALDSLKASHPHLTADLSTETHFPFEQILYQAGLRSKVTLPLLVGGEVFGALNLGGSRRGLFREDQLPVLQQVADAVALTLENSFFFQAEREQRELAEALEAAAAAVSSTLDPDQVLDRILEQVSRVVPNDAANIMLIEGDQTRIVRSRGYEQFGVEEFIPTVTFHIPQTHGFQRMVESGEPMVIPDTLTYPGWVHMPVQEWLRSYAAAPIIVRGEVIGFLNVDSATPGFFTPDHAKALRIFADHAAAAIENARLYEETQQRALEQETLRNAALALTMALDRNQVIERILVQLQQVVPYDSASVQLLRKDRMELVGGRGFSNLPDLLGISFPVNGDNPNSEVIRTRAPFIVEDAPAVYEGFRKGPHQQTVIRSWLGVPMLIGERLVGMIALDKSEPGFYTQEHARLAEAFAAQAAIAIENARLYEAAQQELAERKRAEEALRQRNRELTTLYEAATTISSDLSLNAVLQAVARQMTQAIDSSGCALSLWDRDQNLLETVVDYNKNAPAKTEPPGTTYDLNDYPITRCVLETGRPTVIRRGDPTADEAEVALMESQDALVLLMLPLIVRDRVVGLIELADDIEAREYTPEQIRLAESLAAQAAIAIENARLFEEIEERRVYLEGVLGAALDAIVTLDAHQQIVEWNSGAEKLFGYSREEVVGQNIDYLVTNSDVLKEALEFTQVVMSGLEIPPVETVRYRKDGSPVDVILAASPILVRNELIGIVIVYTDITLRKRMEETLRTLLLIDDLTGLYNRRGFFTLGQQQLKTANRTKMSMLLLFADFDDLKQVNDTFGHPEGDRALVETAHVFRETFRGSDIIARIAGDEFAVLAVETDRFSSDVLATRLQENLEARNASKGRRYKLSLSMGIARYDPEHPCSIDELLARADKAMYEQKQRSQQ